MIGVEKERKQSKKKKKLNIRRGNLQKATKSPDDGAGLRRSAEPMKNTLQGSTSNKLHSCDLQVRVDEGEHSPERGGRGGVCGPPLADRKSVEAF